jgi:hypothetical protein
MCGIYSWAGKNLNDFNRDKFTVLGLYNIERGKDSCGVSYDGELFHGFGTNKLFSSFITKNTIELTKFPTVIGHTRQASFGNTISSKNVHPFGFGVINNNDYEFIGCHNGTIYNADDLADLYNVEKTEKETTFSHHGKTVNLRQKIDSEIILEILYKSKDFSVLSKYNGGAALVFVNNNEPNVIYVWKGASKEYDYYSSPIKEERPLFYYIENKNSLYISSLSESLEAIGGLVNKTVFTFEENTVYKITDGNIEKAEKFKINREESTQKKIITTHYGNVTTNVNNVWNKNKNLLPVTLPQNKLIESKTSFPNIYNEQTLKTQNEYKGRTYFNKLRYWKNGHLLNGIYTFIKGHGFFKLDSENTVYAKQALFSYIGKVFLESRFCCSFENLDLTNNLIYNIIPFKSEIECVNNVHYFVQGVKVETELDFLYCLKTYGISIQKNLNISHYQLSEMSTHPVICLTKNNKHKDTQGIIFKNKLVTDTFSPLGSEKKYVVEKGNLIKQYVSEYGKNLLFEENEIKTVEDLNNLLNPKKSENSKNSKYLDIIETIDENTNIEEILNRFNEEMVEIYLSLTNLNEDFQIIENRTEEIVKKQQQIQVLIDYLEMSPPN